MDDITITERERYVASLIEERSLHLARGLDEQANEVTAELKRIGAEAAPPAKRAAKRPAATSRAKEIR